MADGSNSIEVQAGERTAAAAVWTGLPELSLRQAGGCVGGERAIGVPRGQGLLQFGGNPMVSRPAVRLNGDSRELTLCVEFLAEFQPASVVHSKHLNCRATARRCTFD